jgi:acetyl-CoA C-acetyltransferase
MYRDLVIVAAKRTPLGAFLGSLSEYSAVDLGVACHKACIEQSGISKEQIQEVFMGCVLPAGLGQAPARQTVLGAGLSKHTPATTINKVCGSGMQAIIQACDSIQLGRHHTVLAGGMESMSQAPYLLPKARKGMRMGHAQCLDHMWLDGLQDAYDPEKKLMGYFAEQTAKTLHFSRENQDVFSRFSMERALQAQEKGYFQNELVTLPELSQDECIDAKKLEKLPRLKPAFATDGTVTAGNSSSIADGAASVLIMNEHRAEELGLQPLARICGMSQYAQDPQWFTTAPGHAIEILLKKLNWSAQQVDLWEINEAFALVTMAAITHLNLDVSHVNVHGGACALGHPIGASGARILVSLIYALHQHRKQRGIAAICIGGGEALAMAIERI